MLIKEILKRKTLKQGGGDWLVVRVKLLVKRKRSDPKPEEKNLYYY